ncbi:hypothetical protein DJ568_03430 [Mucilaginibacter hurinus]|uniref:Uncharacterized protein n=2 Tax=Mucilaginibacter hurinus TaxID=2201324 RepID=A0A367GSS9_9SPHI|nr:hypothetical protein DJ568_03430 [Mucilaginibacter hurinus]
MVCLGTVIFVACNSNKNGSDSDSLAIQHTNDTAAVNTNGLLDNCYLHTDGTAAQDSTKVHLIIKDNKVTGEMEWLPMEKDSRSGTLEGTREGNTIKAVWRFMQEGMADSLAVEFDVSGDKLAQKPLVVNTASGRQQTDISAGYTVTFTEVSCK